MCHRILVALDDSPASESVARYVADLAVRLPDVTVVVFHALPPMPGSLLEHAGAAAPADEPHVGARLRSQQADWVAARATEKHSDLRPVTATFEAAGISECRLETVMCPCRPEDDVARLILDAAREYQCDTIAVGRHPKGRGLLGKTHVCDGLLRAASAQTVWVVA